MYLPALFEMAIEEEAADGDMQPQDDSQNSPGSTPVANNSAAAAAAANDIETIETIGNTGEKAGEDGLEDDASAAEREPLQGGGKQPEEEESGGCMSADTKVSIEDDGDNPKQKKWDRKCGVMGVLLLLVILGGAVAGILMNKFASKPVDQVEFAKLFHDHMVLQRAPSRAVVWGYAPLTADNLTVLVQLSGGTQEQDHIVSVTQTLAGPVWKVVLDEVEEPGPFTITVTLNRKTAEKQSAQITDVLFGDVWVCSGQSNMQYSMKMLQEEFEEDLLADLEEHSDIRIMTVGSSKANVPAYDLRTLQLPWSLPTRETLASRRKLANQFSAHFSALCWLFGKELHKKLRYPIGLVSSTYSASALEDWVSLDVINACNINVPHTTSLLYNAMLHPLLSFSFYGMIWYQGETDALQAGRMSGRYNCTFSNMISDLRRKLFDGTMGNTDANIPFGFVQLAPNRDADYLTYGFTDIRWQQTANYGYVPNEKMNKSFMAVAVDLPDANSSHNSIHSRYKMDVAERLTLGALAVAYQQKEVVYRGPRATKYAIHMYNASMVLALHTIELDLRNTTGFEICCSENRSLPCPLSYIKTSYAPDREWLPAEVTAHGTHSLTLSFPECPPARYAVALRYLWRESPCELRACAVYDASSHLPMPPLIAQKLTVDGRWHDFPTGQVHPL